MSRAAVCGACGVVILSQPHVVEAYRSRSDHGARWDARTILHLVLCVRCADAWESGVHELTESVLGVPASPKWAPTNGGTA